jgi:hypothetical protein
VSPVSAGVDRSIDSLVDAFRVEKQEGGVVWWDYSVEGNAC